MFRRFALNGIALAIMAGGAFGESWVETAAECTRFGGRVSESGDPDYPFKCLTPRQDQECVRKHGDGHYFDAEYGACADEECMLFEDEFPEFCVVEP